MTRHMTGLRVWLRPPRNLLVFFILIVCLPAAALVGLGLRMLDQDRELEANRQTDSLDHAAEQAVRILEQNVAAQRNAWKPDHALPRMPRKTQSVSFFTPTAWRRSLPLPFPTIPGRNTLRKCPPLILRNSTSKSFARIDSALCRGTANSRTLQIPQYVPGRYCARGGFFAE